MNSKLLKVAVKSVIVLVVVLRLVMVKHLVVVKKVKKSRSGGGVRLGFEGGQTPLFRRMPKRGFLNVNRKDYAIVNLDTLNRLEDGAEVTALTLVAAKIIKDVKSGVKVLGNGELTVKNLKVDVAKVSASAKAAIEANGGSVVTPEA